MLYSCSRLPPAQTMMGLGIYAMSTVFTTAMGVTAKMGGEVGMPVMQITLARGLVVLCLVSLPQLLYERVNPWGVRRWLLLLRGVLGWASGFTL